MLTKIKIDWQPYTPIEMNRIARRRFYVSPPSMTVTAEEYNCGWSEVARWHDTSRSFWNNYFRSFDGILDLGMHLCC